MHKTFTLLIILFFINTTTIKAQNTKKEEYEKAVDYCACKIAYAYTENYAKNHLSSNEKKSFDNVIKKKIENCDKNTVSNSELSKLLKENNFKSFSKIVIPDAKKAKEKYKDNLSKTDVIKQLIGSFSESFNKIDIKTELESNLKIDRFLKSFVNINKSEIENKTTIDTKTNPKKDNVSFFPNWLLFILILMSSILLFLYNYLNNKKLNASTKKLHKEIAANSKEYEINIINQKISDLNFAIRRLQKDISDLEFAIKRPQKDYSTINNGNSPTQSNQPNIQQNIQKAPSKILYAKAPNEKGEFNALDVSEEKESKFYRFIINDNDNQAEFEFYNFENNAKQAVDAPDIFLPVCDNLEGLNQNARKIITVEKGIVTKQDDKWIVKEKAQITYE